MFPRALILLIGLLKYTPKEDNSPPLAGDGSYPEGYHPGIAPDKE